MNLISVIARYQEDIDWTKDLKGDVIVYNKGSDDLNIPYIKSENIGRESETYCRFIVEWYEHLSNYDSVVFLQGNPFDHCNPLFDKINSAKKDELVYLADTSTQLAYQNRRILNRMNRIEKILEFLSQQPQDNFLRHALALEYIKIGEDQKARDLFIEILTASPDYIGSYYHLAKILEKLAMRQDAIDWYEKGMAAAKLAKDDHAYRELQGAYEELVY
jgi:tetratricopeptide (TPR) repeat protein